MVIATLLRRDRIPLHLRKLALDQSAVDVDDLHTVFGEHGEVAVVERNDVAGVRQDGRDIAGEEGLLFAQADDDRAAAVLGGHQQIGLVLADRRQRVGSRQFPTRFPHGTQQVEPLFHTLIDQVGDQLGIGIGADCGAPGFESRAKVAIVFDDAVVDDDDRSSPVGMGVDFGGLAVGRPAGVADSEMPVERSVAEDGFEIDELALRSTDLEAVALDDRHAGRVIAAIFEAAQAVHENIDSSMFATHVSDDSTHLSVLPSGVAARDWPASRPYWQFSLLPSSLPSWTLFWTPSSRLSSARSSRISLALSSVPSWQPSWQPS